MRLGLVQIERYSVRFHNDERHRIAYKVMITKPKDYMVNTVMGFINPGESKKFRIVKMTETKKKVKLRIYSIAADYGWHDDNIMAKWNMVATYHLEDVTVKKIVIDDNEIQRLRDRIKDLEAEQEFTRMAKVRSERNEAVDYLTSD